MDLTETEFDELSKLLEGKVTTGLFPHEFVDGDGVCLDDEIELDRNQNYSVLRCRTGRSYSELTGSYRGKNGHKCNFYRCAEQVKELEGFGNEPTSFRWDGRYGARHRFHGNLGILSTTGGADPGTS